MSVRKIRANTARARLPLLVLLVCVVGGVVAALRLTKKAPIDYQKLSTTQLKALAESHPSMLALGTLFQRTLDAGNKAEALQIARTMVRQFPQDARAHNALGIAYAAAGDVESARKAFNNAITLDPRRVDPYVNLGKLAMLVNDYEQAATEFDRATTVDPNSASAWTGIGEANVEMHNMQDAVEAFQHAIRTAPNRTEAYAHLGTFLAEMGRGDEARPHLQRALALGDHSAALYAGLAMAYADQPQSPAELQQAIAYATEARKRGQSDGLVNYAQALALQRLGRYQEAIAGYQENIRVSANANGAWIGMSQCYRALGKIKLADQAARIGERILSQRQRVSNLEYMIKSTPGRLDVREQYGDLLTANGQYGPAADQYRYIAQHSPEKPAAWLKVAHVLDLAGDKELADAARKAARAKPAAHAHKGQSLPVLPSGNRL